MRKLEIGQKVRVKCPGSDCHGLTTTVISDLKWMLDHISIPGSGFYGHEIDYSLPGPNGPWAAFEPKYLEPIDDDPHARLRDECAERGDWDQIYQLGWVPRVNEKETRE